MSEKSEFSWGVLALGVVVGLIGGCNVIMYTDQPGAVFEQIVRKCEKNGGLKSADANTVSCFDGAMFAIDYSQHREPLNFTYDNSSVELRIRQTE